MALNRLHPFLRLGRGRIGLGRVYSTKRSSLANNGGYVPADLLPKTMSNQIASPVVDSTGKTRLRDSLERAKRREGPSVGQWLEFPGYSLARTVAPLGEDVSETYNPAHGLDMGMSMSMSMLL
jgi:hypothetical protein